MKTLHRYLLRQILASLLMTVVVFTFVLLLGSALKEILGLLVNRQVTFAVLTQALGLLVPFVLAFALPMGMLTATLLVFGRFSADQELTAVRASGVSLVSLVGPVLLLSLSLCAVSAAINLEIAPRCRVAYKALIDKLKVQIASAYLPEGRAVELTTGDWEGGGDKAVILYVRRNNGRDLRDVLIYQLKAGTTNIVEAKIRAPRGYYEVSADGKVIDLHLFDVHSSRLDGEDWSTGLAREIKIPIRTKSADGSARRIQLSEMTFGQLQDELQRLESRMGGATPLKKPSDRNSPPQREYRKQMVDITSPVRFQIHKGVALSFACFGFALVGIPLGIRVHRRETNVNFGVALILVFIYYSFVLLADGLAMHPNLAPHLMVWLPNFIFQAVGGVLLWRANRGV